MGAIPEGYSGYYLVTFRSADGREHTVTIGMPGTPFDEHKGANPLLWWPPRVYVEGNSWDRDIAVGACEQERIHEDQAHMGMGSVPVHVPSTATASASSPQAASRSP